MGINILMASTRNVSNIMLTHDLTQRVEENPGDENGGTDLENQEHGTYLQTCETPNVGKTNRQNMCYREYRHLKVSRRSHVACGGGSVLKIMLRIRRGCNRMILRYHTKCTGGPTRICLNYGTRNLTWIYLFPINQLSPKMLCTMLVRRHSYRITKLLNTCKDPARMPLGCDKNVHSFRPGTLLGLM